MAAGFHSPFWPMGIAGFAPAPDPVVKDPTLAPITAAFATTAPLGTVVATAAPLPYSGVTTAPLTNSGLTTAPITG